MVNMHLLGTKCKMAYYEWQRNTDIWYTNLHIRNLDYENTESFNQLINKSWILPGERNFCYGVNLFWKIFKV